MSDVLASKDESTELYYAEMEAARNTALDAYFIARPQLARTHAEESIFRAGFERAFAASWNARPAPETPANKAEQACRDILELCAGWDEHGPKGPKPPYRWETVACMAFDYARAALKTGSAPTCEKHGVELAFEGDECWECKKERQL